MSSSKQIAARSLVAAAVAAAVSGTAIAQAQLEEVYAPDPRRYGLRLNVNF